MPLLPVRRLLVEEDTSGAEPVNVLDETKSKKRVIAQRQIALEYFGSLNSLTATYFSSPYSRSMRSLVSNPLINFFHRFKIILRRLLFSCSSA